MTVYVDPARYPFGNMIFCHCWADDLDELLSMMDRIGVQRKWIQGHPTLSLPRFRKASWVHFDISKGKRVLAVKHGAIETDIYGPSEHTARLSIIHGDVNDAQHARKRLKTIQRIRERDHEHESGNSKKLPARRGKGLRG